MDVEVGGTIPWTSLTKNTTSELNCAVHRDELWVCGLWEGKTCISFDKDYNMKKQLETKVARKTFGMVSNGENLILIGGQMRDTTLGGLGLYETVGYVPQRAKRQTKAPGSVQTFINVSILRLMIAKVK